MISEVFNEDCVAGMSRFADGHFDLAIVDPPYGIGIMKQWGRKENGYRQYEKKEWDNNIPTSEYFDELKRVSKNQIIWGGNYFSLPASQCWLVWDKGQRDFTMADGELAWTSFDKAIRIFTYSRATHNSIKTNFHPTEKPVKLYRWILKNFANEGDKILDTHVGSQSSRIAAHDMGFDYTGFEIDADYFKAGNKRFENYKMQTKLF